MRTDENKFKKIVVALLWIAFILILFANREKLTLDKISNLSNINIFFAIPIMLLLFALKSLVMFIYIGILYTACGLIFPLPIALMVNLFGTALMIIIPYFMGKRGGKKIVDNLSKKHEGLSFFKEKENNNTVFAVFFTRMIRILPSDPVGMYFGAKETDFKKYFWGSLLGMMPTTVCFTFMGMGIKDISSPQFIISLIIQIIFATSSIAVYFVIKKRHAR